MFLTLLSPAERDADHPARGSFFPAFAGNALWRTGRGPWALAALLVLGTVAWALGQV